MNMILHQEFITAGFLEERSLCLNLKNSSDIFSLYQETTKKINATVSTEIKTLILTICQLHPLCYVFFWTISRAISLKILSDILKFKSS